jgi:hypothetical protein
MTTTWTAEKLRAEREPDIETLLRERERCIACSHLAHVGICGSTNRVFAKGACQCKGDINANG